MKKLFLIIVISGLFYNEILAQTDLKVIPYFSIKKVYGGLMIGVEILNINSNNSLPTVGYQYEWIFPDISLIPRKSYSNTTFVSLQNSFNSLFILLKTSKFLGKEVYEMKERLTIKPPKVKIVRKHNNILMPLSGIVQKNDILSVVVQNFSSTNLQYFWDFNGMFVSNNKEISVSMLKGSQGLLKVRVFGFLPRDIDVDYQNITIQ